MTESWTFEHCIGCGETADGLATRPVVHDDGTLCGWFVHVKCSSWPGDDETNACNCGRSTTIDWGATAGLDECSADDESESESESAATSAPTGRVDLGEGSSTGAGESYDAGEGSSTGAVGGQSQAWAPAAAVSTAYCVSCGQPLDWPEIQLEETAFLFHGEFACGQRIHQSKGCDTAMDWAWWQCPCGRGLVDGWLDCFDTEGDEIQHLTLVDTRQGASADRGESIRFPASSNGILEGPFNGRVASGLLAPLAETQPGSTDLPTAASNHPAFQIGGDGSSSDESSDSEEH